MKRLTRSITIIEGRCDIQIQEEKEARLITKIFTSKKEKKDIHISDCICQNSGQLCERSWRVAETPNSVLTAGEHD